MTSTRGVAEFISALRAPCGTKLSMRTGTSSGPQLRTKGSRRALHRLANVVDQAFHERFIVAFGHDADQRLGAGLADDETTATFEFGLGGCNPLAHFVGLERSSAAVEAHVLEQLRHRFEEVQHLARGLSGVDKRGKNLKRRNK